MIISRYDGSYVVEKNGMPYHVTPGMPDFEAIDTYAKAHPEDVQPEATPPPPTLEEVKAAKRAEINAERDRREQAGFPYMGTVFDSDPISAQRLTVAANTALMAKMANSPFSITWTTQGNTQIILDADEMMGTLPALAANANALQEQATALKARVDAAATVDEVNAIGWNL